MSDGQDGPLVDNQLILQELLEQQKRIAEIEKKLEQLCDTEGVPTADPVDAKQTSSDGEGCNDRDDKGGDAAAHVQRQGEAPPPNPAAL